MCVCLRACACVRVWRCAEAVIFSLAYRGRAARSRVYPCMHTYVCVRACTAHTRFKFIYARMHARQRAAQAQGRGLPWGGWARALSSVCMCVCACVHVNC